MCYLIHLGVPDWYESSVEDPRDFEVERLHNPSVEEAIGPAFAVFSIASGGCSCPLYEPPRHRGTESRHAEKKRRKTGAIDALENSRLRRPGLLENIAQYVADLAELLLEVKLIVHRYSGPYAEEHVPSSGPRSIRAGDLRKGIALAEDTVYTIRP